MKLGKLFCASKPDTLDSGDWVVARNTYEQTQNLYAKTRLLELVDQEIDDVFKQLQYKHVQPSPASIRRLHAATLPHKEGELAMSILGKMAAIEHAKAETEKERNQLLRSLETSEKSRRQAEFDRSKAEALATARGEALMQATTNLKVAEEQNQQLSEMLQTALSQLGMDLTPDAMKKSMSINHFDDLQSIAAVHSQAPRPAAAAPQLTRCNANRNLTSMTAGGGGGGVNASTEALSLATTTTTTSPVDSQHSHQSYNITNKNAKKENISHNTLALLPPSDSPASLIAHASGEAVEELDDSDALVNVEITPIALLKPSVHAPQELALVPQTKTPEVVIGKQVEGKLRQRKAAELASLMVSEMDAAQLEELVRMGASQTSPLDFSRISTVVYSDTKSHNNNNNTYNSVAASNAAKPRTGGAAQPQRQPAQQVLALPPPAGTFLSPSVVPAVKQSKVYDNPTAAAYQTPQQQQQQQGPLSPQPHVKAVFHNTESHNFYHPFSAGMEQQQKNKHLPAVNRPNQQQPALKSALKHTTTSITKLQRTPSSSQTAPPPKQSTFSIPRNSTQNPTPSASGTGSVQSKQQKPTSTTMRSTNNKQPMQTPTGTGEEYADRQRRAAERLIQRIHERLPAEYQNDGGSAMTS